jgi:CheY-like chemotaxis protein
MDSATIPIIAMTANAYAEDVAQAFASGMNGHIAKPIDIPLLFNMLAKYYEK